MHQDERFDSFYQSTRRGLLLQSFALTGHLPAASGAVRDAYIAAAHHWRKVSALSDPEAWVRPRAWNFAQRRHSTRIWHRSKGISEQHKVVLDAVARLTPAQRRILVLTQLARVPLPHAARELGITRAAAERNLETAMARFAIALDVDSSQVRGSLATLDGAIDGAVLPRASIVRRAGRKRRQTHTLAGVVAAVAVALGSGAIAYESDETPTKDLHLVQPRPLPADAGTIGSELPTSDQMLDSDQIRRLGLSQRWRIDATSNNTSGNGINTVCQQTRFADPDGLSAIVRTFTAAGAPPRAAVQTVEISKSVNQAKKAFRTTVGWFAGCQVGRLQLLDTYRVRGIGDDATVLMVRVWRKPVKTYSVAIARIGAVNTTTVGMTVGGKSTPATEITQSLADSVAMLCARSGSSTCAKQPTFTSAPPPPSGEERGVLAVADLPPVGSIDEPWVGTTPVSARRNPAETTCDHADFASNGATRTRTRTYLIPQAVVPARFGLSETYGVFASARAASRFLTGVRTKVAECSDRDLATTVSDPRASGSAKSPTEWSTWGLTTEVTENESVRFRLGFVRLDNKVAQLTFAPAPRDDMSGTQFRSLVERAGDRLRELGRG